jgi:ABC-2 type transport system ATP-binding protein
MDHNSPSQLAIEVKGLEKRYGDQLAVNGLDLRVESGTFFGLLGPNGAGKTTTVSILTTLARPDAGDVRVAGFDVSRQRAQVRAALGVVFQEPSLDRELTAREHLDLQARFYRLSERSRRVAESLERVGLTADADRPVRGFSGGMKRRLEIARGVLHQPRILFLDEPTLGLDVASRAAVWDHLRTLHEEGGTTIFLTTHSMEEAETLCGRVAIIDAGRRVVEGTPAELVADLGGDVVRIALELADGVQEAPDGAVSAAESVEGVREVRRHGPVLRVTLREGTRRLPALLEALRPYVVVDVELHRPDLEHVFLHHTGHPFEPERLGENGHGGGR